jgi:hypothetical protein
VCEEKILTSIVGQTNEKFGQIDVLVSIYHFFEEVFKEDLGIFAGSSSPC